ncbi:MAG: 16S rRNA (adenine(1518)-N(6)/adenine(1519)-N(6))-dimethyltransferase RsmA [Spirochaetaceae bacterium]|nr:16S rRNA (adenine(1518)-N(6)/adenine(1519)-N(6))-dimethyltransferase RsmA [Spirochaetaceae bacterium]
MPLSPESFPLLPNYNSGPALRAFLEGRGLGIRKQWGQNFLINPRARKFIVDALEGETGSGVWEIGSGPGCMTAELLERGFRVTAFEIDPGFCSLLEELFMPLNKEGEVFTLIRGDAVKTWETVPAGPYLLGNLPYTVAAVLLGGFIENGCFFKRMIVTVQKEVALRMAAPPGSKNYSSISVLCSSAYRIKPLMNLKGASFYPPPHVDSTVLCFERKNDPAQVPLFYPLVRALFASRRKTVANNLEHFSALSGTMKKDMAAAALEQSGVPGEARAERLPPEAFAALAAVLEKYRGEKRT